MRKDWVVLLPGLDFISDVSFALSVSCLPVLCGFLASCVFLGYSLG